MRTNYSKYIYINIIIALLFLLTTSLSFASQLPWQGEDPGTGPEKLKKNIPMASAAELGFYFWQLWGQASEAAKAASMLGVNRESGAIPYLLSMMRDTRLVKAQDTYVQLGKPMYPVGYICSWALGNFGDDTVIPILNYLKDNHQYFYLRGNAAAALAFCLKDSPYTKPAIQKLKGTDYVLIIISALNSCVEMGADTKALHHIANDPDFSMSVGNRAGILTFMQISGIIGDKRVLPVLKQITDDQSFNDEERSAAKQAIEEIKKI